MHSEFFQPGEPNDSHYAILRDSDSPIVAEGRAFVEALWTSVCIYLDADLPEQAMTSYMPRFWEMYLAYVLLEHDITLIPRSLARAIQRAFIAVATPLRRCDRTVPVSPVKATRTVHMPASPASEELDPSADKSRV